MRLSNVPVKGWVDLDTSFRQIGALPPGHPRMMLVHGEPGLGKTTAVDWLSGRTRGVYMVASSTWTQRVLLEKLAGRLGVRVKARARADQILDTILSDLEARSRELIVIDEFDRIAHKTAIVELIREIYDISAVPVALVGMGTIEQTLSAIPQFPQRIGSRVKFAPVDFDDARKIAVGLCEVAVSEDLLRDRWMKTGGIIRLLVTELAQIEAAAKRDGLQSVGLAEMEAM